MIERLKEAAELLRDRADDADPGLWTYDGQTVWNSFPGTAARQTGIHENGIYVATVDPSVGLALADLLDAIAERSATRPAYTQSHIFAAALLLSNALVGGDSNA